MLHDKLWRRGQAITASKTLEILLQQNAMLKNGFLHKKSSKKLQKETSVLEVEYGVGEHEEEEEEEGELTEAEIQKQIRIQQMEQSSMLGNPQHTLYPHYSGKSATAYWIVVFGLLLIEFLVFFFIALFIPSLFLVLFWVFVIFLIVQGLWLFARIFCMNVPGLNWITSIVYIAAEIFFVWLVYYNMSTLSLIISSSIVGAFISIFIVVIFLTREPFETVKTFNPMFDATVSVTTILLLFYLIGFLVSNPAALVYLITLLTFNLALQTINEISEIFKGAMGTYQNRSFVEGNLSMVKLMFAGFIGIVFILKILKVYGFVLYVPWILPPWFLLPITISGPVLVL